MAAHGTMDTAIQAIDRGFSSFVRKPSRDLSSIREGRKNEDDDVLY